MKLKIFCRCSLFPSWSPGWAKDLSAPPGKLWTWSIVACFLKKQTKYKNVNTVFRKRNMLPPSGKKGSWAHQTTDWVWCGLMSQKGYASPTKYHLRTETRSASVLKQHLLLLCTFWWPKSLRNKQILMTTMSLKKKKDPCIRTFDFLNILKPRGYFT
jgi:hypothetical protein